jgi:2-oxoglutarate ferredoxin oxidoreductase subunit beta
VFNDGAFDAVRGKGGAKNQIRLEHGQPIRFGADGERGVVRSPDGGLEVVEVADVDEDALVVHDAHVQDPSHATALARLADSPNVPTPIGVFRDVKRAVYGAERQEELCAAHAGATLADVDELLRSGDTWSV